MVVEGSGQFPDESLTVDNANRGSVRGEPSEGFDTAAGASRRGGLNQLSGRGACRLGAPG